MNIKKKLEKVEKTEKENIKDKIIKIMKEIVMKVTSHLIVKMKK